jgi:PEP-CTERM motif
MRRWIVGSLLTIGMLAGSSPARAAIITLNAVDYGVYDESGQHVASHQGYAAGYDGHFELRNFFVFDLASVSGTIVSASLRLNTFYVNFYQQGTSTYTLFDVTTPIASLIAGGTGLVGTFNDLGSGTTYGNRSYTFGDEFQVRDIALLASGVNALQAAVGGQFALGGTLPPPLFRGFGLHQNVFGGCCGIGPQLVLDVEPVPVPEPATLTLVGFGLAAAVVRRRRAAPPQRG